MFFERRDGTVEFYEGVTAGIFNYKHTDGGDRFIIIAPNKIKKFGFGKKQFRGYFTHEDYPLPLPQDPFMTSEQLNTLVQNSMNDYNKWKAKELQAKGIMWRQIAIGIAIIIGALILGQMFAPGFIGDIISRPTPTPPAPTQPIIATPQPLNATILS